MQTLSALAHAHSLGVVHRDLKPANLMLTDGGTVKVMDFGIARVTGTEHLTSAGFMMGTPAYMAPEQVMGHEIDARTDLYAAGVVLYHLITGRLPFKGHTPIEMAQSRLTDEPTPVRVVREELPPWLGQVLDIALARDPVRRFQTALLFREALGRGLANLPIETPAPAEIPPELVATAAPRSLPVVGGHDTPVAIPVPVTPLPPPADMPTVASARPIPPPPAPAGGRLWIGGSAVVVALLLAGGMIWSRHRAPAPVAPPAAAPAPAPVDPAAVVSSSPDSAPAPQPVPPGPVPGDSAPAPEAAAVAPAPTPVSAAAPTLPAPASTPAPGRADGRGRGRPASNDPPARFDDLHAFVVTGKKAEEQSAVLKFQAGHVALLADKGNRVYGTMAYADITSAGFLRAKNPRWYPTLAGPPPDVDMPGGFFRPSRGWLILQSRSTYLIVRLDDNDPRQVLQTVTERTGLKISDLPPQ